MYFYFMKLARLLTSMLSQKRLAGGAAVLAATQFAASLAGFVRDQSFSVMYPLHTDTLGVASVYIASFRLSDLLFQMFVMSSLSVVLVPFLAGHLAHERTGEMNRLTSSILLLSGVFFALVALAAAAAFPSIAPYLTQYRGESLELYVTFGRYALLTNFLFVFGNTLGQYLIAVQRYWVYGITPVLWSLGTILGVYVLTPVVGPLGPMLGTVAGTVVYVLVRLGGVLYAGYRFELPSPLVHPDLLSMGWMMVPRMVALGALQLQFLIFDNVASGLGTQAVAVNAFARNFQSVVIGVTGIALAQSAFSLLSQAAAKRDAPRLKLYLRKGILLTLALSVPSAIALGVLAAVPAWLLALQSPVRELFIAALIVYCLSIPFESLNHLVLRTFYALKNTSLPALSSFCSVAAAVIAVFTLKDAYGLFALPAAFTIGQAVQLTLLVFLLSVLTKKNALAIFAQRR